MGQLINLVKTCFSKNAEIQDIAEIVNLVSTEILVPIKLIDLHLRQNSVTQLVNQLVNGEFHYFDVTNKKIIDNGIKFSRILFLALTFGVVFDIFVHVIVVPSLQGFQTLPMKMDFVLFDVNDDKYFAYIYAYQILYKPMMLSTFTSLQALPWAFMICAMNQLDVLIKKIENIEELVRVAKESRGIDENEAFKIQLNSYIRSYISILRYIKSMQAALGGQLSTTLFLSGIAICNTAVQILSIESPRENISEVIWVLIYLSLSILILFMDNYFGNEITAKSLQVSTSVFGCPWVTLSKDLKKNIMMFIMIAQQPQLLMAAKLAPVSIATFTTVMNWTYKAFALMNQMK